MRKPDQEAVLRGDRAAFEELVRQETPRLFRVILRIVRDEDEAQSVVQETFLQAYKGLATFRRESKLTTWLYGIGINLARAALRKQKRLQVVDDEEMERLQPAFHGGNYAQGYDPWNPEQMAEREDRKRLVNRAIESLPEQYRTVLVLRDMEGWSTEEAARALETSEGAVRVRLHRARQALRALLDPYFRS